MSLPPQLRGEVESYRNVLVPRVNTIQSNTVQAVSLGKSVGYQPVGANSLVSANSSELGPAIKSVLEEVGQDSVYDSGTSRILNTGVAPTITPQFVNGSGLVTGGTIGQSRLPVLSAPGATTFSPSQTSRFVPSQAPSIFKPFNPSGR